MYTFDYDYATDSNGDYVGLGYKFYYNDKQILPHKLSKFLNEIAITQEQEIPKDRTNQTQAELRITESFEILT